MEETKERVRVRSAATTEVASGSKELGDQIARLMAALTRVEQGSHPASAPNSPRHRGNGRGQVDRNTPVHTSSHNGWTGLGQTASICSFSTTNRKSTEFQRKGTMWAQNSTQGGAQSTRDSNTLQCFRCQSWGHMARECTTLSKMLNKDRGTWGNAVKPPPTIHSKFTTFPLWPQTKTDPIKGSNKKEQKGIAPILFLNPDPVA